jgi:hypothetical protein
MSKRLSNLYAVEEKIRNRIRVATATPNQWHEWATALLAEVEELIKEGEAEEAEG